MLSDNLSTVTYIDTYVTSDYYTYSKSSDKFIKISNIKESNTLIEITIGDEVRLVDAEDLLVAIKRCTLGH